MARVARRHKVGLGHVLAVINSVEPLMVWRDRIYWLGEDDRGVELEIIAIADANLAGDLLIIHAMPTALR